MCPEPPVYSVLQVQQVQLAHKGLPVHKVQLDRKVQLVLIQLCRAQQVLKELPEPEPLAQLVFKVQLA